ncbi:hypothetical protein SDC9_155126 [bioreactor metagenome]|uniref:Uncharacterized protein n=1 Tax=bioreactor metagenome TaxID=1076179 RepID=A0A645F5H9_9ZZZZ
MSVELRLTDVKILDQGALAHLPDVQTAQLVSEFATMLVEEQRPVVVQMLLLV